MDSLKQGGMNMVTFLGIPLSKEEELFLTSVIIKMADGQKLSEADILHNLLKMAESQNKLDIAKRELKKLRKNAEDKSDSDKLFLGKSLAYNKAIDLLS